MQLKLFMNDFYLNIDRHMIMDSHVTIDLLWIFYLHRLLLACTWSPLWTCVVDSPTHMCSLVAVDSHGCRLAWLARVGDVLVADSHGVCGRC